METRTLIAQKQRMCRLQVETIKMLQEHIDILAKELLFELQEINDWDVLLLQDKEEYENNKEDFFKDVVFQYSYLGTSLSVIRKTKRILVLSLEYPLEQQVANHKNRL